MITPRWVATRTQPIAADDVVRYLLGVLARRRRRAGYSKPGGPRCCSTSPARRVAAIQGRPLPVVSVPLLTPWLSSR